MDFSYNFTILSTFQTENLLLQWVSFFTLKKITGGCRFGFDRYQRNSVLNRGQIKSYGWSDSDRQQF